MTWMVTCNHGSFQAPPVGLEVLSSAIRANGGGGHSAAVRRCTALEWG